MVVSNAGLGNFKQGRGLWYISFLVVGYFSDYCLGYYGLLAPEYDKQCTYQIYKASLANLCKEYNIDLNHHNALSDAMACAKLYQLHLEN